MNRIPWVPKHNEQYDQYIRFNDLDEDALEGVYEVRVLGQTHHQVVDDLPDQDP